MNLKYCKHHFATCEKLKVENDDTVLYSDHILLLRLSKKPIASVRIEPAITRLNTRYLLKFQEWIIGLELDDFVNSKVTVCSFLYKVLLLKYFNVKLDVKSTKQNVKSKIRFR